MSPSYWGPNTWIFIHTLAEKIKDSSFPIIGGQLISFIRLICRHLPCPECAQHAAQFWKNVDESKITTKQDLISLLFVFHNVVNNRKKQPLYKFDDLSVYKYKSLNDTFIQFVRVYNTKGNMNFISESFHRDMFISNFRNWLKLNIHHFDP